MTELKRVITTPTPLTRVWPFLSDFATTETWDPGTVTCRSLTPGPVAIGSRFENVSTFKGKQSTLLYEVTELVDGARIVLQGSNKTVTSVDTMELAATPDGGTTVTYTAHFTFKGLAALAQPFLKGSLNTLGDEAAAGMTKALAALS